MSAYSCAQLHEVAPELALGVLGGAERAEAIIHVNGCARCQALVNELTEVADALPMLAPEHEPPPGFEQRVLAAGRARRRRSVRRWVASIAAAAAAAAILSITIVRVVDAGNDSPAAAARKPVEARMVTMVGDWPAGWAYVTNAHSVAVAVNYNNFPSGDYRVVVTPRGGTSATIDTMHVDQGRGSSTGVSVKPLRWGSTIELVDPSGTHVCRGTVGAAA
jgi:hypothetical protein